jgi:hypothetical protein
MPVFDSQGMTVLATQDPGTDQSLPYDYRFPDVGSAPGVHTLGHLIYSNIASTGALLQTTGVDCKLLHGDEWDQLGQFGESNLTTNITGNEARTIGSALQVPNPPPPQPPPQDGEPAPPPAPSQGTHAELIGGDQTITVFGNVTFTVQPTGSYTDIENGPVNRTFMQPVSETYSADHSVDQPESWYDAKFTDISFVILVHEIVAVHAEIVGIHAEACSIHGEAKVIHAEAFGVNCSAVDIDTQDADLEEKLAPIKADIHALQVKVGGVQPKAVGLVATAGADPNPTPMV